MEKKIIYISAGEGKMNLWNKDGIVFSSSKAKELAKAFLKHGWADTFGTSSSFDFGRESGFRTNDAVRKLFYRTFEIINKS
jgi:hypothetical protein